MNEQLLVTTDWLAARLDAPKLLIVDIRGHVLPATEPPPHYFNHHADYLESHIPGAVFVDWVHEITDPADPRHARLAPPDRFAAAMRRIGVGPEMQVVAYDDAGGMFAARLWWSLHYYGHRRVAVLDGGWPKWIAEGRPTSVDLPPVAPGDFSPRPDSGIFAGRDDVLAALGTDTRLIDVRSPDEFAGRASRAKRAGHIPGAVNVPRTSLLNPDGTLLAPGELRARFASAGVDAGARVIVYCNAGVSASFGMLALRRAGIMSGRVYDGSWKDWANDDATPVALGP